MLTVDSHSLRDIGFANSLKTKNPIKKDHCISNKTFVVIDDELVKCLEIDEENTWFEQEQIQNGVLFKIHNSFHVTESQA